MDWDKLKIFHTVAEAGVRLAAARFTASAACGFTGAAKWLRSAASADKRKSTVASECCLALLQSSDLGHTFR